MAFQNIIEIEKGLWRGPAIDFIDRRYRSILCLETKTRELICGDVNKEFRQCQDNNIIFFDTPWSGIFPPKQEDIASALGVLMHGVRPLYFHCRAGRERTGFLAAAYRMHVQKWTFEQAYNEWKEMGCRFPTYWLWKKALRKWESKA